MDEMCKKNSVLEIVVVIILIIILSPVLLYQSVKK